MIDLPSNNARSTMSTFTKTDWFLGLRESPFLIARQAWIGLRMIRTKTVRIVCSESTFGTPKLQSLDRFRSFLRFVSKRKNFHFWLAIDSSYFLCPFLRKVY